jgi:ATP-dependent helicase HepA
MTGFPGRSARLAPLSAPPDNGALLHRLAVEAASDLGEGKPPRDYHYDQDPRVRWLADFLNHEPGRKVLLICSSRAKVLQLDDALRQRVSARIALFHEDLALVQRDRNAAWFAEDEGAQVLLCSEIGGEGRNFQFAHHLVLFDLPLAPERLEQRVGRLDRIGQTETIRIHLPYVEGSAQEVLVRWYHEGLDAVGRCLHGGHACGVAFGGRVRTLVVGRLARQADDERELEQLVAESRAFQRELAVQLERGRDHLLELSSFRPEPAAELVAGIEARDGDLSLDQFMIRVFDHFGIEIEEMSERTYLIRPGPLVTDAFPGIPAEGVMVTADRQHGLVRDDLGFLSWDHPMVTGAMDMLLGSEHGNSTFAVWESDGEPDVLLEALYVLEPIGGAGLHVDRFLPPTPIRVVVDRGGADRTAEFAYEVLCDRLADGQGTRILRDTTLAQRTLPPMVAVAGDLAKQRVLAVVEPALQTMREQLGDELHRLQVLQKRNDHVRDDELRLAAAQILELGEVMGAARLRLDALRLICTGRW